MMTKEKEITARDAVLAAIRFYEEITDSEFNGSLEEVEYLDGAWNITLGFTLYPMPTLPIRPSKDYKVIKVNAKNGAVISMKIRD